jgi:hypothetical protein
VVAADISAIAALIAAVTLLISVLVNRRTLRAVHNEVKTSNGLTLAALSDRAEGRRIESDVEPEDRTESEQRYVTNLDESTPE